MKISHVHEKKLLTMRYLAEPLINEMHIMSYLLLNIYFGLLRISLSNSPWDYSYDYADFQPDFLIEAILIKKNMYF